MPSQLARDLKAWGFDIITAIRTDSDMYKALDVLAREVKILGIFYDWPATVTYHANCMGLQ